MNAEKKTLVHTYLQWRLKEEGGAEMPRHRLIFRLPEKKAILYCPAVFSHFSPAPVKTDRVIRIQ